LPLRHEGSKLHKERGAESGMLKAEGLRLQAMAFRLFQTTSFMCRSTAAENSKIMADSS